MHYTISYSNPFTQYIDIEFSLNVNQTETIVKLPLWRPGRYELGNFAKNIQRFNCFNEKGESLTFSKINKSAWRVNTENTSKLTIRYNYYAAELNAGSTFLSEDQLYVNPVNCLLYTDESIESPCTLKLNIPEIYTVATAMQSAGKKSFVTKDFHELADSPFIASATLQQTTFILDGIAFFIWMQGNCKPDWSKLTSDFMLFIAKQLATFKSIPTDQYHFLFQIVPYKQYHGVEHLNSTVIALGPAEEVFEKPLYNELLGVSSHELFHVWNVKSIRPADMLPYRYDRENYSQLGFIYEGVTTYYGDLMLYRSGVFSDEEYFKTFNEQLNKHFNNTGRHNMSVADSSFDTWLDGYTPGIPGRKVSIYTEGCLHAFMLDILIRKYSLNNYSLDDVMRKLNDEHGRLQKGYTAYDYQKIAEHFAGVSLQDFFNDYIFGTNDDEMLLKDCLEYLGLKMKKQVSDNMLESNFGFKYAIESQGLRVIGIFPDSSAYDVLKINDLIFEINGLKVPEQLSELFEGAYTEDLFIKLTSWGYQKENRLIKNNSNTYCYYCIEKNFDTTDEGAKNFVQWGERLF